MRESGGRPAAAVGRNFWGWAAAAVLILGLGLTLGVPSGARAQAQPAEVRNLGISRLGERTMVTVLLDRPATPRVAPYLGQGRSQLIMEFPQSWAGKLPETIAGDEVLVKQIRSEVSEAGVKIILEMFPERPYIWKRQMTPLSGGRAMFRLTLWADPEAAAPGPPTALPPPTPPLAPRAPEAAAPAPAPDLEASPGEQAGEEEPPPATPVPPAPAPAAPPSGPFAELYSLVPQARGLWDYLRGEGWIVAQAQSYDKPGTRSSRSFHLTNPRYLEMKVRVAHLPPNAPGTPGISIVDLSMDNLTGKAADEYRKLRQWNFGKIKTKYEDIGDFFDEALKPLRVEIRQKCQTLARRHAEVIKGFLGQAAPRKPQLGDKAISLIGKKISPRFEGVQYTLSENPLVILNLVDFLYIRVYFLNN
jgi:hypothetical protein